MIKIGILIKDFEKLKNWELRIVQGILDDPELHLTLLIQDGRIESGKVNNTRNKISRLFQSNNLFGKVLFKLQAKVEERLFPNRMSVNKKEIVGKLHETQIIKLSPKKKGFLDIFSEEDSALVKGFQLDLILRHEFNIIRGPILTSAKYGIWSFHHADNSVNRGGPVGFWEILLKQSSVGVTLQQLTPELDGGLIIDKAFFNRQWSFVKTSHSVFEGSVSVLFKNLRQLKKGIYSPAKSAVYFNPLYKSPDFAKVLKYQYNFYKKILAKALERIDTKMFGARYECWSLFIGKGSFLESALFRLKPIMPAKNEFWADPFILNYKSNHYVFFENYSYKTKRGKISCGMIEDKQLVKIVDVLDLDYHLSFPYIFEEDGNLFLMPETLGNNRLELYKCVDFPTKWELYSVAFEGERVVDAFVYFDDIHRQKWLFVNKQVDINTSICSELFIYRVNGAGLNDLEPHQQNPVIINSKTARNGGCVFKYNNEVFRPSQANIDGIYGRALNINKIEKLTIDEYVENTITTVFPNFHKGLISTHHLHQTDDYFVIDAAFRRK